MHSENYGIFIIYTCVATARTVQKQAMLSGNEANKLQPPKITISEVGSLLHDSTPADSSLTPSHEREIDISGMMPLRAL